MRVAPGFEPVADAFTGGFFAATVDGEPVVDLGAGDDLVLIFSGTKGLVAICLLKLIEQGRLALDEPLATYWPEFGNRDVLVRHAVSHTAGLPGLVPPPELEELLDDERMAGRVAAQQLFWPAGERLAYHALTYGWLCGELVRRIDGQSIGRFFAEEVAGPLGLELWIGLPEELEPRVAELVRAPDYAVSFQGNDLRLLEAQYGPLLTRFPWNEEAFHAAEIPAANAIGTARSVALLYGRLDRILRPETQLLGRTELSRDVCAITRYPYAFGVGFELQTELGTLGPPGNAFGHTGSGGSAHGAWPDEGVGFSYAPTELRRFEDDGRAKRLLTALHSCLHGRT
ncbi:MAG: serine hydrolase domain-containing protein [Gaiellaceae bacterium]